LLQRGYPVDKRRAEVADRYKRKAQHGKGKGAQRYRRAFAGIFIHPYHPTVSIGGGAHFIPRGQNQSEKLPAYNDTGEFLPPRFVKV
jgi:hypothetical protein